MGPGREYTLGRKKDHLNFTAVNWGLGENWPWLEFTDYEIG